MGKNRTKIKMIGMMIYHALAMIIISYLSLMVRFDFKTINIDIYYLNNIWRYTPINIVLTILIYMALRLYQILWKYAGVKENIRVVWSALAATLVQVVAMYLLDLHMPRSYHIYYFFLLLAMTFLGFYWRRIINAFERRENEGTDIHKAIIVGGGEAAQIILKEIQNSEHVKVEVPCIVDDNPAKKGTFLKNVPIVGGRERLPQLVEQYEVDEIMIAIPSLYGEERKKLIEDCSGLGCKVSIMPGMYQLINREINFSTMREVELEDLLGRNAVETNLDTVMKYVSGKVVLVTGGGGSIGSELCRQIANYLPKQLIVLDNYENNAYELQMELKKTHPYLDLEVVIASVQNEKRIETIFQKYHPNLVYHAAAHKHVPLMEESPCEAIKNNVCGTAIVARQADRAHVERFVMISTDKAVRPTNIMGASKRICEMVVQMYNRHSDTEYVAVRFGNVLGSNGSVVPLFKKQIAQGGPVTVTHPEVTRFFMTIPEAVSLVLQAGAFAHGGEIFILDMGQPVKIVDMAKKLIKLSGFEPGRDIEIKFTGLRPGEKLYEELLMDEEKTQTDNKRIFVGKPIEVDEEKLTDMLNKLKEAAYSESDRIREMVKEIVPEYHKQ
ncbi:polysaccharide biosynthesis protein [Eubacterium oxidoreducens]|uniref:NDP-sugar epimerase, includes UDP-GlcNAc-inverting 4,6-dehydratase FlaA1 and capsular polysaccharide biosynthesis protein EpsC n=1 Tax=Eubacterium oxidoreducens TaxID=1732 RepID=A0A1G6BKX0_EUBOX|nr:nucleoside-diphosphate sugar epimerase/dehydratase [Eubacterium oxidoreducens]SDB21266.1 NDP-sugar epimerase, includes UDP-GlcNAc-inverting 4,6-dehydratase FlaA1 and capsular polysaccharide biosynthesis protein EpsC [Eubacterium oxidoreducens]